MGRYSYSNRIKAEDLYKIDMTMLKKYSYVYNANKYQWGQVTWTNKYGDTQMTVNIVIRTDDERKSMEATYDVKDSINGGFMSTSLVFSIVSTDCNFGGKRYWFKCSISINGQYCGRRIRILYRCGDFFGCRHCFNLTYSSRNENRRGSLRIPLKAFDLFDKIEILRKSMKLMFYNGRFTRKARKLIKLNRKANQYLKVLS